MGDHADILDLGEIDGIVVVFQENRLFRNDDPMVRDDHQIEIIIDDLKEKGIDIEDEDNDGQKGEKGIEKNDFKGNDDGTQDQKEKKSHGSDQEAEEDRLQEMGPMPT
jgi:hypothetical protein